MTSHDDPHGSDFPWRAPKGPSPGVLDAIRADIVRDLKPARGPSAGVRLAASLGIVVVVLGAAVVRSGQGVTRLLSVPSVLLGTVAWGGILAVMLGAHVARVPGRRGSFGWRRWLGLLVPTAFFAFLALTASDVVPLLDAVTGPAGFHALMCGVHALVYGLITGGGLVLLWRGTDPLSPIVTGSILGLVGGLTGALAMGITCPAGEMWHLWLGHGLTVVLIVVAGALLGRRWLSP